MVLSLTTGPDGNEDHYARIVAEELGVPALDVKVVPADENRFGAGHGFNTSPSDGTPGAIVSASGKIRAKAQLLAGAAMDAPPDSLRWDNGAFVSGGNGDGDGAQGQTIADPALYAPRPRAPPPRGPGGAGADDRRPRSVRPRLRRPAARRRGRPRRADRLRGLNDREHADPSRPLHPGARRRHAHGPDRQGRRRVEGRAQPAHRGDDVAR